MGGVIRSHMKVVVVVATKCDAYDKVCRMYATAAAAAAVVAVSLSENFVCVDV